MGESDGVSTGDLLGTSEGTSEGTLVGRTVGTALGACDGLSLGLYVGISVGDVVSVLEGSVLGILDGHWLGTLVGTLVGALVGVVEGTCDGTVDGLGVVDVNTHSGVSGAISTVYMGLNAAPYAKDTGAPETLKTASKLPSRFSVRLDIGKGFPTLINCPSKGTTHPSDVYTNWITDTPNRMPVTASPTTAYTLEPASCCAKTTPILRPLLATGVKSM